MITEKTVYTATDGQQFETLAKALAHEHGSAILKDVLALAAPSGVRVFDDIGAGLITDYAAELFEIFNRHIDERSWFAAQTVEADATFKCFVCGEEADGIDAIGDHECNGPREATGADFARSSTKRMMPLRKRQVSPDELAGLSGHGGPLWPDGQPGLHGYGAQNALEAIRKRQVDAYRQMLDTMEGVEPAAEHAAQEDAAAIKAALAAGAAAYDPSTARVEPGIPAGVYYSEHAGNFYDVRTGEGMGMAFYKQWIGRLEEFPESPQLHVEPLAPVTSEGVRLVPRGALPAAALAVSPGTGGEDPEGKLVDYSKSSV